jgi:hypothetical protein
VLRFYGCIGVDHGGVSRQHEECFYNHCTNPHRHPIQTSSDSRRAETMRKNKRNQSCGSKERNLEASVTQHPTAIQTDEGSKRHRLPSRGLSLLTPRAEIRRGEAAAGHWDSVPPRKQSKPNKKRRQEEAKRLIYSTRQVR